MARCWQLAMNQVFEIPHQCHLQACLPLQYSETALRRTDLPEPVHSRWLSLTPQMSANTENGDVGRKYPSIFRIEPENRECSVLMFQACACQQQSVSGKPHSSAAAMVTFLPSSRA